jgi:hypothetical protein
VRKPVTVLSVIVVTTYRLLNKPINNLNCVFSRKTRYNIVTNLHYAGHPLPRGDVTGDAAVTTQLWTALGSVP